MEKLLKIVQELQSHSGKNDKKRIIRDNLDNELFVEMMRFLLNSFILTGISKKKISKKVKEVKLVEGSTIHCIAGAMNYLRWFSSGRDYDICVVQRFLNNIENVDIKAMCQQIITKDLKLGVSARTWNELVNDELKIPVFDVLLAKKFEDHSHKIKGEFVITEKLDGTRCVAIKEDGKVKFYTRQGKEYVGLVEIEKDLLNRNIPDGYMFDGEILADIEGNTNEVFAETIKKSRTKDKHKTGLKYHIFDMMPLEEFQCGQSELCAIDRKNEIHDMFDNINPKHLVHVRPLYMGDDFSQIAKWSNWARENKLEGIMLNMDKPYVCKRSDSLLKVKDMHSCDLRVVGFEEGEGRNSGKLGAIICEYKDNTVKVGSGWSDEMRELVWNNQDDWINSIIEVQFFEESKDSKTGQLSLRFPVFKCRRDDKDEPSYN